MIRGVTALSRKRSLKRGFKQRNHHPCPGGARYRGPAVEWDEPGLGRGGGGGPGPGPGPRIRTRIRTRTRTRDQDQDPGPGVGSRSRVLGPGAGPGAGGSAPGAGAVQGMERRTGGFGGVCGGVGYRDASPSSSFPGQLPSANKTEEDNWSKSGSLMFLCLKLKAQQHETT